MCVHVNGSYSGILLNKSFGYFPIISLDKTVNIFRCISSHLLRHFEHKVICCRTLEENTSAF